MTSKSSSVSLFVSRTKLGLPFTGQLNTNYSLEAAAATAAAADFYSHEHKKEANDTPDSIPHEGER